MTRRHAALANLPCPCVTFGQGPVPLVMLPGVGESLRLATDVGPQLRRFYRRRHARHCIAALSRREPIPADYSLAEHAQDAIRTFEALGWGPAIWECNSAGGAIGQLIAAERPDLVRGLVLNSSFHRLNTRLRAVLHHWLRMATDDSQFDAISRGLDRIYIPSVARGLRAPNRAAQSSDASPSYPGRLQRILNQLLEFDHRALLPRIACPTLVIAGAEDRLVRPEITREMASLLPDSRLVFCPGYGHENGLENPEYEAHLAHFVDEVLATQPACGL